MKNTNSDEIILSGGNSYITHNANHAFQVLEGNILIYIVPWKNEMAGRRSLLCEVGKGVLFPAFAYKDLEYRDWRFCIVAVDNAKIVCRKDFVTTPLKRRFLNIAGVHTFDQEGYEESLVDYYRMRIVSEDGYFIRTQREKERTAQKVNDLIQSVFGSNRYKIEQESDSALYNVMRYLCKKAGVQVATFQEITDCFGKHFDVPDIASISHFPCREVLLEEGWYLHDAGFLLVSYGEKQEPAACIPKGQNRYELIRNGEKPIQINKSIAIECNPKAWMIYKSFPAKRINVKDFAQFCMTCFRKADAALVFGMTAVTSLIVLLLPVLNQMLYDQFIPMGRHVVVIQIGLLIIAFMIGNIMFSIIKNLGSLRLGSHIQYDVQNAAYYRLFQLPESFFRNYESADLAGRIMELGSLAGNLTSLLLTSCIVIISVCIYLIQMFVYSVTLSGISVCMFILYALIVFLIGKQQISYQKSIMELNGKTDSVMYQFIHGIDKLRMTGNEERALFEYMKPMIQQRKYATRAGRNSNINGIILTTSSSLFTMVIYIAAYKLQGALSVGQFMAFTSAFGMVSGAVTQLIQGVLDFQVIKPAYNRIRPILEAEPEVSDKKTLPGDISGKINIDHLSFRYNDNMPFVIKDLSLHINSGEYIGIVGSSGCGKSTFLKLLLGFEQPVQGKIYYDNQDLQELNLQELRKKFGVVLQDGKLISGSIFENITITAPEATVDDVNHVIEAVGLATDISEMPMGLHTVLSEDCGTISGGQQQRILIARAIINHPRLVFFDEATSALDNITQEKICQALEEMNGCTRVVIAHRLSTIKKCDRILVFDHGQIVEEGNYDSLMNEKGLFYQLASRQILNSPM